jgi:predicted Rossmann-fold nucleotide-binding protein
MLSVGAETYLEGTLDHSPEPSMIAHLVEYAVARKCGEGWIVLRDGSPVALRRAFANAVDFATHLAEREACVYGGATRVVMGESASHRSSNDDAWRRAA